MFSRFKIISSFIDPLSSYSWHNGNDTFYWICTLLDASRVCELALTTYAINEIVISLGITSTDARRPAALNINPVVARPGLAGPTVTALGSLVLSHE